jgi:starch synthase
MDKLRIVMVSAECVPFAKVGGLADVTSALSRVLAGQGHTVHVLLPRYAAIDAERHGLRPLAVPKGAAVPAGGRQFPLRLWEAPLGPEGARAIFIDEPEYFGLPGIYTDPKTGKGYDDNDKRFAFFCRAALETLRALDLPADVLHCHDHQAAFVPALLSRGLVAGDALRRAATVFTIHNLGYQGIHAPEILEFAGFSAGEFVPMGTFEFFGKVNFMKVGIELSDMVSTVSERYAEEIQGSPEYGMGLENVLQARRGDVVGILNGVDYGDWDPRVDKLIAAQYGPETLADKQKNKAALQARVGLPSVTGRPLIGVISRLADQKGFDLIERAASRILTEDVSIVVLGSGERRYETFFSELRARNPERVAIELGFNNELAHLIEAGSDMFLMPSRYEPCGLNQMYSLRYGTVPIVRATGGLADTVRDFDPATGKGNGFVFEAYDAGAMADAIHRALAAYRKPEVWRKIVLAGMACDFSWGVSAEKYVRLYRAAMEKRTARV